MLYQRALCNLANTKHTLPVISQLLQLHSCSSDITPRFKPRCSTKPLATKYDPKCYTKYATKYATNVVQADNNVGILQQVLKKLGFTDNSKSRLRVCSHILYESVADKINYMYFFEYFELPNTFNSWFLVTELHVWMILVRAMAEGPEPGQDGRFLRNCIVEALWKDVNTRAKKLGAQNPSRTRQHIELLSEQFQAALVNYDEGIMSDDKALAEALWRRFFEMKRNDYTKLEALVKYVRQQIDMLDHLNRKDFLVKPKIPWLDFERDTLKDNDLLRNKIGTI